MAGTRWTDRPGRIGGAVYDAGGEREWLARPAGRLLWGTDTRLLYAAIRAIGELPDGAAVLDVPAEAGWRCVDCGPGCDTWARTSRRACWRGPGGRPCVAGWRSSSSRRMPPGYPSPAMSSTSA